MYKGPIGGKGGVGKISSGGVGTGESVSHGGQGGSKSGGKGGGEGSLGTVDRGGDSFTMLAHGHGVHLHLGAQLKAVHLGQVLSLQLSTEVHMHLGAQPRLCT